MKNLESEGEDAGQVRTSLVGDGGDVGGVNEGSWIISGQPNKLYEHHHRQDYRKLARVVGQLQVEQVVVWQRPAQCAARRRRQAAPGGGDTRAGGEKVQGVLR